MKNDNQISQVEFEEIERYLSKDMPAEEYEAFDAKLAEDPELMEMVNETRLLLFGIKEAALQNKLEEFHKEIIPQKQTKKQTAKLFTARYWLAAASVIIIAATIGVITFNRKNQNEKFFANYFEADPGLITAMGVSEEYEFDRAMVDYKRGNFKPALDSWKKLMVTRPDNDTLNYFTGVAYLALGHADSAILFLEKTIVSDQTAFRSDAYWYLGLGMLKQGKKEQAISFLKESQHPKKEELLSRLK